MRIDSNTKSVAKRVICTLLMMIWAVVTLPQARAADPAAELVEHLAKHCFDCHSGSSSEAGLDLAELNWDLRDAATFATWVQVHDRVAAGEMPPPDATTMDQSQRTALVAQLGQALRTYQRQIQQEQGRVVARRLTHSQLEATLQDLLGIDVPLTRHLPQPPRTGEYTTLAELQTLSHFDLENHVQVVDMALDEAMRRALTPTTPWKRRFSAKELSRTRTRTREPEYIDGAAVVWSGRLIFYGRLPATTAREDGWYRIRFEASALKKPADRGVWCTVRSGKCVSSAPLMSWVGAFEVDEEKKTVDMVTWLPQGHMLEIRPNDVTLKRARFQGGQAANGEGGAQDVPGLAIHWLEMERIHPIADDAFVRQRLFGRIKVTPHDDPLQAKCECDHPLAAGEELICRMAGLAWRRPVERAELEPYLALYRKTWEGTQSIPESLRVAYTAILCSPRFLYFEESPGRLDPYAIATRLSYFLCHSLPDEALFQAARQGELRADQPEAILSHAHRLLRTPRGEQFMARFAGEWLELRDIEFTEPDARLHPDFDLIVQDAMLQETHAFLQHLLERNAPIGELVAAPYTFLNSRLARYYGVSGVRGDTLRCVDLPPDSHRGGILSHGSVLKVTANGTNTSPVLRGVWVARRILGEDIPPPPANVPAIEPDIRGAKTIREQLEKHRQDEQCASCHRKIDPPGFALENFDAAGRWREFYPVVRGGKVQKGPRIDPSYVWESGGSFEDFESFRELVQRREEDLARNLIEQMLVYGTGARISFADRSEVERLTRQVAAQGYGIRAILDAVVTSSIFLSK
ncbi:MAG: cytochrome c [Pirellulaceae bacterium]|nr:MAG: cytochrome c [Pirellulaceae bacterium]